MKTYTYTINNELLFDMLDLEKFKNKKNILIQVFSGQKKETFSNIIKSIDTILPNAVCIGCTTDGEIDGHQVYTSHTTISISDFDHTNIKAIFVNSDNSYINGQIITSSLITTNTKLLIFFAESYHISAEDFLAGVENTNNKVIFEW